MTRISKKKKLGDLKLVAAYILNMFIARTSNAIAEQTLLEYISCD